MAGSRPKADLGEDVLGHVVSLARIEPAQQAEHDPRRVRLPIMYWIIQLCTPDARKRSPKPGRRSSK